MASYIDKAVDAFERVKQFVTKDAWGLASKDERLPHGFLFKHVRVLVLVFHGFFKDNLLLRASGLTFSTLLALVPFFAAIVFVVQAFDLQATIIDSVVELVFRGVPEQEEVAAAAESAANGAAAGQAQAFDLRAQIRDLAERLVTPPEAGDGEEAQGGSFLVVGVFVLMTVFGLMNNIESSFNQIWGITRTRSYYRMATDYLVVLLGLPLLVALMLSSVVSQAVEERLAGPLLWMANQAAVWLAFTALYFFVPNTRVKVRYALLGGIVSGLAWSIASWAYVDYQVGLERYSLVYSVFAQVPLLLMWIFVSWVIVLFGAELTFAFQNEKTFAMERLAADASYAYREAVGLRVMLDIAHRFDEGERGLDVTEAAEAWNVPTRLINDTLDDLEDSGLVKRVATEPVSWQPARSIDRIRLGDVLAALREAGRDPSPLLRSEAFRELLDELTGCGNGARELCLGEVVRQERFQDLLNATTEQSEPGPATA
jgi:membrane protein